MKKLLIIILLATTIFFYQPTTTLAEPTNLDNGNQPRVSLTCKNLDVLYHCTGRVFRGMPPFSIVSWKTGSNPWRQSQGTSAREYTTRVGNVCTQNMPVQFKVEDSRGNVSNVAQFGC